MKPSYNEAEFSYMNVPGRLIRKPAGAWLTLIIHKLTTRITLPEI